MRIANTQPYMGKITFKSIALAPVRAGFTALLLVNFRAFASRLKKALAASPSMVKALSDKFGYDYAKLKSYINTGANKKALFPPKANGVRVGAVSVIVAAAAAAPLIVAVTALLKQLNLGEPADVEAIQQAGIDITTIPGTGVAPPGTTPGVFDIVTDFWNGLSPIAKLGIGAATAYAVKKTLLK